MGDEKCWIWGAEKCSLGGWKVLFGGMKRYNLGGWKDTNQGGWSVLGWNDTQSHSDTQPELEFCLLKHPFQLNVLFKRSKWTQQNISFEQSNTFSFKVILVADKFWSINTEVNHAVFTTGRSMHGWNGFRSIQKPPQGYTFPLCWRLKPILNLSNLTPPCLVTFWHLYEFVAK